MALLSLNRVELEDTGNLPVSSFHQELSECEAAGIVIVFHIRAGRKIGIITVKKYNIRALGGKFFV